MQLPPETVGEMMTGERPKPEDDPARPADLPDPPVSPALLRALAAHPAEMAHLIKSLHVQVRDEEGLLDLMQRVAAEAVRLIDDVDWAGVTAEFAGAPFTTAHTHSRVLIVDEGQYDEGDGPCLRALRTGRTVTMTFDEVRDAWPHLARTAAAAGVVAFRAEPLYACERSVGALNMYSAEPQGLQAPDADLLAVLTDYLGRGLSAYSAVQPAMAPAIRLKAAMQNRELIGQAIGVLMAVYDIDTERARSRLRAIASAQGVDLVSAATALIDGHTRR